MQKASLNENLLVKMKKTSQRVSQRLCGLISVFSILFIILAWQGLDPLEGKYESLSFATFSENRESFDVCEGRRIFMYDLPLKFNIAVNNESRCERSLIGWIDLCPRFSNGGYGAKLGSENVSLPASYSDDFDKYNWYETDSYMLEMIFHTRLQKYGCLTKDPSQADAFFVPYYTGLLALDHLYDLKDGAATFEKRKNFGQELLDRLAENGGENWSRFGGRDHFIVKGRTTWDFRVSSQWGTGFSQLPYASNMTGLLLERRSDIPHEMAIPYPTAFHPDSPQRLQAWIEKVENSSRKYLFSYVGAPRTDSLSVRGLIGNACIDAGSSVCNLVNCSIVRCSHDPVTTYKSFLSSKFCLQPQGDTATRRSTFDCLISGAVPVFFHNDSAYTQYKWHLPQDPESYSVYIPEEDLKKGTVSIQDILMSYSPQQISQIRRNIVSIIPNLIYNGYENDPSSSLSSKDAYEISLERVLERVAAVRKELAPEASCRLNKVAL